MTEKGHLCLISPISKSSSICFLCFYTGSLGFLWLYTHLREQKTDKIFWSPPSPTRKHPRLQEGIWSHPFEGAFAATCGVLCPPGSLSFDLPILGRVTATQTLATIQNARWGERQAFLTSGMWYTRQAFADCPLAFQQECKCACKKRDPTTPTCLPRTPSVKQTQLQVFANKEDTRLLFRLPTIPTTLVFSACYLSAPFLLPPTRILDLEASMLRFFPHSAGYSAVKAFFPSSFTNLAPRTACLPSFRTGLQRSPSFASWFYRD